MKEIEVKILEINLPEIRRKLIRLGARNTFDGELHVAVFDYPQGKFEKTKEYLRLRTVGNKTELCYKGKNTSKKFKIREEIEVHVDSFEKTATILQRIGLKKVYDYHKHRESYRLGSVKVDIDTHPGVPTYLEIEAPTEKQVEAAVKKLGYAMAQTTNISIGEILRKMKRHRRILRW